MQEQYNHKDHFRAEGDVIKSPSASEISLRDSLIKLLRDSGIEVIDDVVEGQRVLAVGSSAEGAKKLNDLNTNVVRYQKAYHGSVNDFDAFDTMSHLSEGEGNQAFGAGTYVADQKDLGVQYANIAYDNNHIKQTEHWNAKRLISRFPTFEDFLNNPKTKEAMAKNGKTIADLKAYYENSTKLAEPPHVLYTLDIPDDNGKNYLDWDGWLSRKQADTIRERLYKSILALNDDYKGSEKYLAQDLSVIKKGSHIGDTYGTISDYLGSDKLASEFLHDLGYTGIKVHAAHNSNDVRYKDNWNYVIFNDKDLKIKDKIRFFRTSNGDAYGFTSGGKIYIDPRIATAETPIHEYAHLWGEALRKGNPEEWKNVVGLMKQETVIWDDVKKNYPHLESDDDIADEVLATYSGRLGAKKLRALRDSIVDSEDTVDNKRAALSSLERFRQLLSRLWKDIADLLHIHFTSAEEVADKVMGDLLNGFNPEKIQVSSPLDSSIADRNDYVDASTDEVTVYPKRIKEWLSKESIDRARGKSKDDIIGMFGNEPEPIAYVPKDYLYVLGNNVTDNRIYSGKGYFIDHALNHHPQIDAKTYDYMQEVLSHPNDIKATNNGVAFIKKIDQWNAVVVSVEKTKDGKIIWHKSFYDQKKEIYKNRPSIMKRGLSADATPSINPANKAFGSKRSISALDNPIAKIGNISDNNVNKDENLSADPKIRFQFIGERGAENIDRSEEHNARMDDLRVAREMEAAGKDDKTIKMATGWECGADGKWRYEIGDGTMKSGWEAKARVGSVALSDVIDNEELFTSFPQMRNISVALSVMEDGTVGWYNSLLDRIELNDNPSVDLQGVLLHEIQHAIQHAEGFEPGTNTERTSAVVEKMKDTYWKEVVDIENRLAEVELENNIDVDMEKWLDRYAKFSNPDVQRLHDEYRTLTDKYFQIVTAEEMYHRNAGEVEARNVERRMNMPSEERRRTLALETEDVARKDQIFLRDDIAISANNSTEDVPRHLQIMNNQHMDNSQSIAMAPLQPRLTPLYHAMEYSLTHDGVWMLPTHRQHPVPSSPFVDLMMVLKSNHDTSTLTPKQTGEKPQLEQSLPNSKKIYFDALALARQVGDAEGFRVERYFKPMDSQYDPKSDKVRYMMIPTKDLSNMPSTLGAVRANDLYRAVVSAIGGHERLERQDRLPLLTDDASKHELLVRDIAAGVLMSRQGLPAVFSKEVQDNIAYYEREIKENPSFEASLMKDVDSTMKALDLSIKGERVDYATLRRSQPAAVDQRSYSIVQDLAKFPNSESREVIVIKDKAAGKADVILPQGASKRVWDEAPGLHKDDLTKALEKNGITKVSYYNSGGSLRLMQSNDYFKGKEVLLANYSKQSLNTKKTLDLSAAIRKTHDKVIEKFRCIKDDNGKYVFFLKPEGEKSFSVYPSKEQRDRFFKAAKEEKSDREKIRYDICQETYRYAKEHPEAKREVIMPPLAEDIDLSKISDVSLKREESSHCVFIEAKINGEVKRQPVTPQQWERLWLADDMQAYKNNLAANIFAPDIKVKYEDVMESVKDPEISNGSEGQSTEESEEEEEEEVRRPVLHL